MNTARPGRGAIQVQTSVNRGDIRRPLRGWAAGLFVATVLATILPATISFSADDDPVHEVTWVHGSPGDVRSFVVFVSPVEGSVADARQINVGKPDGTGSGSVQFYSALVPVGVGEFVAVGALGQDDLLSGLSEWRPAQPSRPGQPLVIEP
jgi:hypothetical protein